jgi:hypothetical protein
MIPGRIYYKSKYGDPCSVAGSFDKIGDYYHIFSFENHPYPPIHKDKISCIHLINLNNYERE